MTDALAAAIARIGQVQQPLSGWTAALLALVGAGGILPSIWSVTQHLTTVAAAGAHATAGSAVGRRIAGFAITRNATSSVILSGAGKAAAIWTTFVGYLGPSVLGVGAAGMIRTGYIVAVLWIGLAGLLMIVLGLRRSFGIISVVLTLGLLFLVAGFAAVGVQVAAAYVLAWFLLISGVHDIARQGKRAAHAGTLRGMTRIPAGFWSRVGLVGSVAALIFGAMLLI